MHDKTRVSLGHRARTAEPAGRRAWTAPRASRFALSAAEAGGDTNVDGVELLS